MVYVTCLTPAINLNTFSIAARSKDGKSFGVAVSTARPNVGSLVPFVSLKGAIATQARVNTDFGRHGLSLLEADMPITTALESLLTADANRDIRQLHGVDANSSFAFTGKDCVNWAGHIKKEDFSVAGNMLTGEKVVTAMAKAFQENEALGLSERLVLALEAAQLAGGDKRGKQSAALLVASQAPRLYHNVRVDDHSDPVKELRRIYELIKEESDKLKNQYGEAGLSLFSKVKTWLLYS